MAGKRKQEERRLTNELQEKPIELYHNESDLWNVSSASYFKKECRQGVLLNTKQNISASHHNLCVWNFAYDFVLLYYRSSSIVTNLRQSMWELCPFWNLQNWKCTVFRSFL